MSDMFGWTDAELAQEAGREVVQRCTVYQRLVAAGKMSQDRADRQIEMMREIARRLSPVDKRPNFDPVDR